MNPDDLKSKKSELRLYCDLLMQQVHMVKTAVNNKDGPEMQTLDEASNLLTATCDTFIKTLEECMTMTNEALVQTLPIYNESPLLPIPPGHNHIHRKVIIRYIFINGLCINNLILFLVVKSCE